MWSILELNPCRKYFFGIFTRCASMVQYLVKIPMPDPDEHTHLMSMWQVNNVQATVSPGYTP